MSTPTPAPSVEGAVQCSAVQSRTCTAVQEPFSWHSVFNILLWSRVGIVHFGSLKDFSKSAAFMALQCNAVLCSAVLYLYYDERRDTR